MARLKADTAFRTAPSIILAAMLCPIALGEVPTYSTFELQCRSNFGTNPSGSFNLPGSSFFTSGTPALNDAGQVVIRLLSIEGDGNRKGLFLGSGGAGGIVWEADYDVFISDASINNNGYVVLPQTFSSLNGVYYYDHATGMDGFLTNAPLGTSDWSSPTVNDNGEVSYRINFTGSRGWYSYSPSGGAFHLLESSLEPTSDYNFLFTPTMNNSREIAGKAQLGAGGNHILRVDAAGNITVIAADTSADAGSPYTSFSNSVSMTDDGRVAFEAGMVGGGRGIFLSDGVNTVTIATTSQPEINSFDFFTPVVNNNGLVAFRARDAMNRYVIYASDGTALRRVVGQFDQLQTDVGLAQIAQHDSSVVFGGSPAINDHGDIAFNAALTPHDNDQIEWGSGIFIAYADSVAVPGDLNNDGVVNVGDLLILLAAWGDCDDVNDCPADLNGDGSVNVGDMLILLSNWG